MRLISLKLKAFGCFADETCIDFSEFESGLYIITGETGSGKTTINDAIMVALYNEASSGSKKVDRSVDGFYSHHVAPGTDSYVEVEFSHNDNVYRVVRKFTPVKNQKTKCYDSRKETSFIYENGNHLAEYKSNSDVTNKVKDLLKISVDQFRMICMLPQGQFKKFLEAGSSERGEILAEIFDTTPYVIYQTIIDRTCEKLTKQVEKDGIGAMEEAVSNLEFGKEMSDEDKAKYNVGNDKLEEDLLELLEFEKKSYTDNQNNSNKLEKLIEDKNALIIKTTQNNKDLAELKELNDESVILESKKQAMDELNIKSRRVNNAYAYVLPADKTYQRAICAVNEKKASIADYKNQLADLEIAYKEASAVYEKEEVNRPEIESLMVSIKELKDQIAKYDIVAGDNAVRLDKINESKILAEKETQARNNVNSLKERLTEAGNNKNALEGCKELLVSKKAEVNEYNKQIEEVSGPNGLLSKLNKIKSLEGQARNMESTIVESCNKAKEASDEYNRLYKQFIDGQAGILGDYLTDNIKNCGKANCPVCNAEYKKESIVSYDMFAHRLLDTPNEEMLDEARALVDKKREEVNFARTEKEKLEASINSMRDNVVEGFSKFTGLTITWIALTNNDTVNSFVTTLNNNMLNAKADCDNAQKKVEEYTRLSSVIEAITLKLETSQKLIDKITEDKHVIDLEVKQISAKLEAIKEELKYENKEQAEKAHRETVEKYNTLVKAYNNAMTNCNNAKTKYEKTKSVYNAELENLPGLEKQQSDSLDRLNEVLGEYSFKDVNEAQFLLASVDSLDVREWIDEATSKYNDYRAKCMHVNESIIRLSEKTKGTSIVDTSVLEEEIVSLKTEKQVLDSYNDSLNILIHNHKINYEKIHNANSCIASSRVALNRLKKLRDIAMGSSTDGGKLSFERYVMGSVFKQVLDKANIRLNIMSGGRFEFVHVIEGMTKSSQAGLEIEMNDLTTGMRCNTPSLSGGESFMASLSLALGLSDVVKEYAGGISLDTLFIDEGFGTLDEKVLDKAIQVLVGLAGDNRQVGIISHVKKLEETISQQIRVIKSDKGSKLKVVK